MDLSGLSMTVVLVLVLALLQVCYMSLSGLSVTLALVIVLVLLYVCYMSHNHGLLRKLGIPGPRPWPVAGHLVQEMGQGFMKYHRVAYEKYKGEKVYGLYRGRQAYIVICDLDMIKDVCVTHFQHFVNRTTFAIDDPFDGAMSQIKDEHWKTVRATLSPAFNTVRLKRIYKHIAVKTKSLLEFFKQKQESNEPVELRETLSLFSLDLIASAGFGVDANSLEDKTNSFYTETTKMFKNLSPLIAIAVLFSFLAPVLKFFGIGLFPKSSMEFYKQFTDMAIASRKEERGTVPSRNDFLQLMMEAVNDTQADDDNMSVEESKALNSRSVKRGLSYKDIQGQAIQFITAGYETVASALSWTLFLMALNPESLQKAQKEIDEKLEGKFPDYDSSQSLHYLEMCLNEALRMYPAAPVLDRVCNEEIVLEGITIPKGVSVSFPVIGIHYDPDIWQEPEVFNPERFTTENKAERHQYSFLPFGQGPRNCIGQRLALLECMVALAAILHQFTPVRCDKTVYPPEIFPFRVMAKDGLWVRLEARK